MPPNWLAIRQGRSDLTDYLIHWTREQTIDNERLSAFDMLKLIVKCGFLKPSFAPRLRATIGGEVNTIKGPYPAVCFTEQPLDAFLKSCDILPSRYQPYAIAMRKEQLFIYGGRPVIYGDELLLNTLAEEYKYLWVRFNPLRAYELGGYPVDWTHEREWRSRVNRYHYLDLASTPGEGVPLLLPPDSGSPNPALVLPWFLVKENHEVEELEQWIARLPSYSGSNRWLQKYFEVLPKVPIVPLDKVRQRLNQEDMRWTRLDTLPYEEFDPQGANELTRIGWRSLQ